MYSLRQATKDDYDFLYRVHVATLRDYVYQTWGRWDEAEQAARFAAKFHLLDYQIIVVNDEDVGYLQVEKGNTELFLVNIRIMPEYQGQGLGTDVIKDVIAEGERDHLPVMLRVLKVNPARRLYERLGFAVTGETETHYLMATNVEQSK